MNWEYDFFRNYKICRKLEEQKKTFKTEKVRLFVVAFWLVNDFTAHGHGMINLSSVFIFFTLTAQEGTFFAIKEKSNDKEI